MELSGVQAAMLARVYAFNPLISIGQWDCNDGDLPFKVDQPLSEFTYYRSLIHYYHTDIIEGDKMAIYTVYFTAALDGKLLLSKPDDICNTKLVYISLDDDSLRDEPCYGREKCRLAGPDVWCESCCGEICDLGASCISILMNSHECMTPNDIPIEQVLYVGRKVRALNCEWDIKKVEELCLQRRPYDIDRMKNDVANSDMMIKHWTSKKAAYEAALELALDPDFPYFGILAELKDQQKREVEQRIAEQLRRKLEEEARRQQLEEKQRREAAEKQEMILKLVEERDRLAAKIRELSA
jgi:hypothetical protein